MRALSRTIRSLLVFLALPFAAAMAQERVTISADNAKLYQQPTFSASGTAIARGAVLTVLERTGDWISVFDGSKQGFVHKALVVAAPAAAQHNASPYGAQGAQSYPQQPYPQQAYPQQPYPQAAPQQAYPQAAPQQAYPQAAPQQGYTPTMAPPGVYAKPGQVRFPGQPGYKDPTVARVIGLLVPGGEGFYTGNMSRGIFKAAVGYGALFVVPAVMANKEVSDCTNDVYSGNYDASSCDGSSVAWASLLGWGTYMTMVIHGVITGGDVADAANRRPTYAVTPIIQPARNGGTAFGLRVSLPSTFTK